MTMRENRMRVGKWILFGLILVVFMILIGVGLVGHFKGKIQSLFKLNEARKIEGYHVGGFEFQMLGIAYWLDHGNYVKAVSKMNELQHRLESRDGLTKIPLFTDAREKWLFYQGLQNPKTGAFMDDSYPLFTYIGPTANMIAFLSEDLAAAAQEAFRLHYPLTFLNDIDRPENLISFLNDTSQVGWIGARLPKTPFVEIGELIELSRQVEALGLHSFTPQWREAFARWCYENQNPETGLWGSRLRSTGKWLDGGSLTDTGMIIGIFMDNNGKVIDERFPLKHQNQLRSATLEKLKAPMPDNLGYLHTWILDQVRGLRILARYLWKAAPEKDRAAAQALFENLTRIRFEHFYVKKDQAFSLYPDAENADLDGVGEALSAFKEAGMFNPERQAFLWGSPRQTMTDLGVRDVVSLTPVDLAPLLNDRDINSIRIYASDPEGRFHEKVLEVVYPRDTAVLDLVDWLPRLAGWAANTTQGMGNWVTRDAIVRRITGDLVVESVPVSSGAALARINRLLEETGQLTIIGFDLLQVPRVKVVCRPTGHSLSDFTCKPVRSVFIIK